MKRAKRARRPKKTLRRTRSADSPATRRTSRAGKRWAAVDHYLSEHLLADEPILASVIENSAAAGLPAIAVSPTQGKLLQMLVEMIGARSVLEVGTLGGYSTIWIARGLAAGGSVITLEVDPKHADVARENFALAGLQHVIELRLGNALDTLPRLANQVSAPFDLVFVDADKQNIPTYFDWAIKLAHSGSLIIVDNVVRDGEVINAMSTDPSIQGVRRFLEQVGVDSRVTGTAIQTVGTKGYDGFAILRVR